MWQVRESFESFENIGELHNVVHPHDLMLSSEGPWSPNEKVGAPGLRRPPAGAEQHSIHVRNGCMVPSESRPFTERSQNGHSKGRVDGRVP